jgi:hypothetical protein
MIGRVILEMKMKSKNFFIETTIQGMKPKDLISMKTVWAEADSRYLVIKVNRKLKSIDLLPLEDFYMNQKKQEAPVLSVPFYMIKNISKIDKGDLLFLANHKNPHIINALENS